MKITLKTSEVVKIYNDLTEFLKKDINFPKQLIWDLDENYETISKLNERFEKCRAQILQPLNDKHAFEPIDDDRFRVKDEYYDEFLAASKEIDEFLDTTSDVEIKVIDKNSIPDSLSFKDWKALKFMCGDPAQ